MHSNVWQVNILAVEVWLALKDETRVQWFCTCAFFAVVRYRNVSGLFF